MSLTSTERSRRCRLLQRSKSLAPAVITSKVRKFLRSHPDQAPAIDAFMLKLAKSVRKVDATTPAPRKSTWEAEYPNGKACEYNEDCEGD